MVFHKQRVETTIPQEAMWVWSPSEQLTDDAGDRVGGGHGQLRVTHNGQQLGHQAHASHQLTVGLGLAVPEQSALISVK